MAQGTSGSLRTSFAKKRALVTGGAGFIGAALVHRLVELDAEVAVLDSFFPGGGGNDANLETVRDRIRLVAGDVREPAVLAPLVEGRDYLFNLAARTSHMDSLEDPLADLDVNARAALALIEHCRRHAPGIIIVYAGTRQIYGAPDRLPVDEAHPLRPPDPNGVSKLAGEAYHLLYHRIHGLAATSLRLTNTYGPRMRIKDARQMFLGDWIGRVLSGRPIEVWGGGQRRDLSYVEDAAEALLLLAATPAARGLAFNIGAGGSISLLDLARALAAAAGGGRFEVKEFPPSRKRIDIGDYEADDGLLRRLTGWAPAVPLEDGLARTIAYYRPRLAAYLR